MPKIRIRFTISEGESSGTSQDRERLARSELGDKFTAAFGPSTAEHFLPVRSCHALTESVSFFPNYIGWCL